MAEPSGDVGEEQLARDLQELDHLVADTGVELSGPVIQVADDAWVVFGTYAYEGEVIVGEYPDPAEAAAVLRAAPTGDADEQAGVPLEGPSWWKEY